MEIVDAEVAVFFDWLRLLAGRSGEGHTNDKLKGQKSNIKMKVSRPASRDSIILGFGFRNTKTVFLQH